MTLTVVLQAVAKSVRGVKMQLREKRRKNPNAWFFGDDWDNDGEVPEATVSNGEVHEDTLLCFRKPAIVHRGRIKDDSKVKQSCKA